MRMLIDSGADVNTVGERDWVELLEDNIHGGDKISDLKWGDGKRMLAAYASNTPLVIEATFSAQIQVSTLGDTIQAQFFVIRGARKSLLGRETAIALKVLRLGLEVNSCEVQTKDVASEAIFPKVPGELIHFDIDYSVVPTKNSYVSIPAAFKQSARERLNLMQRQGIIEDVVKAPKWLSGLTLVPKGKTDFRLVVNMRGPNRGIRRPYHPLPTIDDMKVKLVGAVVFTKLDIKSAFHHLELDEESRELTTFQTDAGMKRFTRLVFGVNCAPEIFQRTMERILKGINGVLIFIDDILIFASDRPELRKRSTLVIEALTTNNLTLNEEKCEFEKTSIKFLGHQLSKDGFAIDAEKVQDVMAFEPPGNATELRSFLGLAAYLREYIPNFADMVNPMWEVLKIKPFAWTQEADEAFEKTKLTIANCTTKLSFFDENAKTIVYTDASPHALGAVLVQETEGDLPRIICFASKTLTPTERIYPQIQKEALGIVWAVERLYYYLLGRKFVIRTDARGLAFIFDREKTTGKRALNRAEGWALRISGLDYTIEWIKGQKNIADPLSRLVQESATGSSFPRKLSIPGEICALSSEPVELGAISLKAMRAATRDDAELRKVSHALETDEWPTELNKFEKIKSELRNTKGLIVRMGAIVVPTELRAQMLKLAHEGHPGRSAMKSILRSRVWWPRMPTDAEEWVKKCQGCTLASGGERPVPMLHTVLPSEPWEKIAIDMNGPHSACALKYVLVVVDYFSRFVIARFIKSTDKASVVNVLGEVFDLLGSPASIRSDNGPPFNGTEWAEFCANRGTDTEFSTPGHPQQNGLVERYMQIVNKIVTIAVESGVNSEVALAEAMRAHNAAIQRTTNVAPEVLLFGRRRRGKIPMLGFTTTQVQLEDLRARDEAAKQKTEERENVKRRARPASIKEGDEVYVKRHLKGKDQTKFAPERFTVLSGERGDFVVKGTSGSKLKRNIIQLKKAPGSGKSTQLEGYAPNKECETQIEDSRPKRTRAPPGHLADYVLAVEEQKKELN